MPVASQPAPRWCWIVPHAIACDGFRWPARTDCLTDGSLELFALFVRHQGLYREGGASAYMLQTAFTSVDPAEFARRDRS